MWSVRMSAVPTPYRRNARRRLRLNDDLLRSAAAQQAHGQRRERVDAYFGGAAAELMTQSIFELATWTYW
jgi:hypothetical protein